MRLRKCGRNVTCPELVGRCSIVRELHVYGTAVPVHGRDVDKLQHQVIHLFTCRQCMNVSCVQSSENLKRQISASDGQASLVNMTVFSHCYPILFFSLFILCIVIRKVLLQLLTLFCVCVYSQGYGTLLMEEAERIARKEHRSKKLAVISGVGTRHYYRKLGYELEGPYVVKCLA